jgi:hypothetical protein
MALYQATVYRASILKNFFTKILASITDVLIILTILIYLLLIFATNAVPIAKNAILPLQQIAILAWTTSYFIFKASVLILALWIF